MVESIEKLRESLKDCTREAGVEPNRFDTYWITARACDMLIDEIEAEIESRYIELPVDADGVPWHIGDAIKGHGELRCMSLDKYGWAFAGSTAIDPRIHRHVKPRTIEDVLTDLVNEVARQGHQIGLTGHELTMRYAAEIRELMKVDLDSCWFANFGNPERMAQTIIDTCCYDCKTCPFNSVELLLGKSIPCKDYYGCEQAQYGEILAWLKDGAR